MRSSRPRIIPGMGALLLFFDGIGVGPNDVDGTLFRPIDATLGVPGLPPSATGQTSLLTGINAARHAGGHQLGLPGPTLRPLIESDSIFLKLTVIGRQGAALSHDFTGEWMERRGFTMPRHLDRQAGPGPASRTAGRCRS